MSKYSIEQKTIANEYYRKVVLTNNQLQLVVMSLEPMEDIPEEVHPNTTQFIKVEQGTATAIVKGKKYTLKAGDSITINPKTKHYIANQGKEALKLYTIYTPPEHPVHRINKRQPRLEHN